MRCVVLALAVIGCSGGPDEVSKPLTASPEELERLCELAGEPAGCDVCETHRWYEDGVCDAFCTSPDPDCAVPDSAHADGGEHDAAVSDAGGPDVPAPDASADGGVDAGASVGITCISTFGEVVRDEECIEGEVVVEENVIFYTVRNLFDESCYLSTDSTGIVALYNGDPVIGPSGSGWAVGLEAVGDLVSLGGNAIRAEVDAGRGAHCVTGAPYIQVVCTGMGEIDDRAGCL